MYQIKVLATNADGNSTFSDSRAFNIQSTFGLECPPTPDEVIPDIPGPYLGITPIDQTSVRVGFLFISIKQAWISGLEKTFPFLYFCV